MSAPYGPRPRIYLRREPFERACRNHGLDAGIVRRSAFIGVSHTTLWRILQGSLRPGEAFIAATLTAFNDLTFDDLFEIIHDDDATADQAA